MRISYKKLWVMLIEKEISKATLRQATELSPGTMSKLNKNEEVALLYYCVYANILTVTSEIFAKLYE